jgi:hypothetical protein
MRCAMLRRVCGVCCCRYPLYRSFYTGRVTIYCDGSVLLSHAGVEIGQVRVGQRYLAHTFMCVRGAQAGRGGGGGKRYWVK